MAAHSFNHEDWLREEGRLTDTDTSQWAAKFSVLRRGET